MNQLSQRQMDLFIQSYQINACTIISIIADSQVLK